MKRFTAMLLVICSMLLLTTSAFADAKMTAVEKTLITFQGDWKGYFFAKVENTGDTAGYIEYGGKLVGFDDNDDVILSEDYISSYPSRIYLQPGEYAYVRNYFLEDALRTSKIADYKFSIKPDSNGYQYSKLPSEAKIEYKPSDKYNNDIYVTFTNDTDDILYDFAITVAMFDQDNHLIFVDGDSSSSLGIHPGSTITVKVSIDSDLVEYYAREGITPTTVESIVYVEK